MEPQIAMKGNTSTPFSPYLTELKTIHLQISSRSLSQA